MFRRYLVNQSSTIVKACTRRGQLRAISSSTRSGSWGSSRTFASRGTTALTVAFTFSAYLAAQYQWASAKAEEVSSVTLPSIIEESDIQLSPPRLLTQDDFEESPVSSENTTPDSSDSEGTPEAEGAAPEEKGAYDPETGEINWDCPCLGGMAHGPCGEEFKDAFSCFVYSNAEPKGVDCIEKFQAMQNCFRKHPELYADELRDELPVESPEDAASTKE